ncbi:MAG TPA: cysteine desulfurase family protein [Blastocatellia bacterium]|nr:cysteine desulfurase family protein [Blastocatellia bacterium]
MTKRVYFDNSATTAVDPDVVAAMLPYFSELYGNASSLHYYGQQSKKAIATARRSVAELIGADQNEICFLSGGTEADNLAVIGIAEEHAQWGRHVVTTEIEHPAVLKACAELAERGWDVTHVPVSRGGVVSADDVRSAIRDDTVLVSVMHVNNEIGTIQPIGEIGATVRERRDAGQNHLHLHTDAVQSVGKIHVDVRELGVDLLSIAGHKLHAPKGVGALFVRKGIRLHQRQYGGHQERGRRPGTEAVPLIVGLGAACRLARERLAHRMVKVAGLRDRLEEELIRTVPGVTVNGDPAHRVPHILNASFRDVAGEGLLISLDLKGICVATGAACSSGSLEPSHVLVALGIDRELIHGSLRFSLAESNTDAEVDYVLATLPDVVSRLREDMSTTGASAD